MAEKVASLYAELGMESAGFTRGLKQAETGLTRLDKGARIASRGLGGVMDVLPVAGLATLAAMAARATKEMADLGQQIRRQQAYFTAYSGGVAQATTNLNAMKVAVGGAATESEMLVAANKFLSMGLATNSDELAKLSRMAVMLGGDTRSAGDAMQEFALLLANQSILRLDTFGISGAKVRARVEELKASVQGISDETAFMTAVMEEGTVSLQKLEAQGLTPAGTAANELRVSWMELREEIAKGIGDPQGGVASLERWAADQLKSVRLALQLGSDDTTVQLGALEQKYKNLIELRDQLNKQKPPFGSLAMNQLVFDLAEVEARLRATKGEINKLTATSDELKRWAGVAGLMADATADVAANAPAAAFGITDMGLAARYAERYITDAAGALEELNRRAAGFNLGPGPLMPNVDWEAALAEQSFGGQYTDYYESFLPAGASRDWAKMVEDDLVSAQQSANREFLSGLKRAGKEGASDLERELKRAFDSSVNAFTGKMQEGIGFSIGLNPMLPGGDKGPNAPGAGGAFEDIYRLQAWLNDGSWGETAEKFGLDRAGAESVVSKFQQGIFDQSVLAVIDKDKLIEQIKSSNLAAATQEAFAKELALAAGTDGTAVKALMGFGTDTEGKATTPDMKPLAANMTGAMGDALAADTAGTTRIANVLATGLASSFGTEVTKTPWAALIVAAITANMLAYFEGKK